MRVNTLVRHSVFRAVGTPRSLRSLAMRHSDLARRAGPQPIDPERLDVLTDRERDVVRLAAAGLTNDQIAERLIISPHTAKTHINRAMTKLDARDRAQLVITAYQTGLARPPGSALG